MSSKKKGGKLLKGTRGPKKPIVPKWKLFRANEPLLSVFMWGVNHCTQELAHVPPPTLLMPDDFKAYAKVKVDNHLFNKDAMPSHFKVKEYCPNVFRNLRERFGIDESQYLRSLVVSQPEARDSPGRSGAKFYSSHDEKLIIKTQRAEEIAEIHQILQDYHRYVVEKHGKTLLPQYLGMYRLTVEGTEHYLIVMRNILPSHFPLHKKYDLKGSTVSRAASEKEKSKELPTFKDNDFLEEGAKLHLPPDAHAKLLQMLVADTEFLAKLHLMDYSLLVGIHDVDRAAEEAREAAEREEKAEGEATGDSSEPEEEGELPATPPDSPLPSAGPFALDSAGDLDHEFYAIPAHASAPKKEIYFVGLVDILTYFGMKKKTAAAAKSVKYGAEADISTVKPDQYAKRLQDFVEKALAHPLDEAPASSLPATATPINTQL